MTVRDYIKMLMKMFEPHKDKQPNYHYYKWVLERGKVRKTVKFSKKELKFIKDTMERAVFVPQAKDCYRVSQLMAVTIEDFKYVEGYATSIIPTDHAWLEYRGKVLDPVWGCHSKSPDGFSASPNDEYFGVEVPVNLITENIVKTELAQPMLFKMFMKENENRKGGE